MTVQEQYGLLEKTIRGYNPAADFDHIRAAFEYADRCHEGQKRKSGEPYHPSPGRGPDRGGGAEAGLGVH